MSEAASTAPIFNRYKNIVLRFKLNSIEQSFDAVKKILNNLPKSWLELTTHRLDIYDEGQAKSQFLEQLKAYHAAGNYSAETLEQLPTAYDYIRLGHQLSSLLEWAVGQINHVTAEQVIAFSSKTMPILAVLRKKKLTKTKTVLYYNTDSSPLIDEFRLQEIYGYEINLIKIDSASEVKEHSGSTVVFVTQSSLSKKVDVPPNVDLTINVHPDYGSTAIVSKAQAEALVKDIQHVRRRESIAITPPNALNLLREIILDEVISPEQANADSLDIITRCIHENTGSTGLALVASSGLSIQYAIMMGLVEDAMTAHPNKPIAIILPPNCYGGTNDQARRIAALIPNAEIVDLLVDGGQDLVNSLKTALAQVAEQDGVPIVLAEIPTNPRVEVPDLNSLAEVLATTRSTPNGETAIAPTFMVDQTFCPNVKLLGDDSPMAKVKVVSFSSGSKFPSGGRCIGGYCATNKLAEFLQVIIGKHLTLSDNSAVSHQLNTLAENMPSMPSRIKQAYENTLLFVNHIEQKLPKARINFVSQDLAEQGFTPSVFSLDIPSTGSTPIEKEENKRLLNERLIELMITRHPTECKHCVSYGQLKGSYWTIPATSTQGTTKETDKDYIVRVALSPDVDVNALIDTFSDFCEEQNLV